MSQKGRGGIPRFFVCQILWVGVGVVDFCSLLSIPVHAALSFSEVKKPTKNQKEKAGKNGDARRLLM